MGEPSLKQKTAGAIFWNLLDRIGQLVLVFVTGIIVTNQLNVEDYSLFGMFAIFIGISTVLLDSGFSAALIRKKHPTNEDYNSVFWFNVTIGIFLYLLLQLCAPLIARFYGQPQLVPLAALLFLALPINAFASIQTVFLNKEVRFRVLARVNLIAITMAAAIQLTMAFTGFGVWTLVAQPVVFGAIRAVLLWFQSTWRPSKSFSFPAIKELFGFASKLLAARLINTSFMNIYSAVIGKIYPHKELGYYTQGNKMCDMGVSIMYSSIESATFPIFSSIQDEKERLLQAYRKTIRFTAFVALPAMAGLAIVARPLIELLLKEEYWPSIPFLQLLCIGGCFTIFTAVNNNFIKVKGHSGTILHIEYFRIALTVIGLLLTWNYPVLIMIAGLVITRALIYIIHMIYTGHYTGYSIWMQLWDVLPYLVLTAVMAIIIYPLHLVIDSNLLLLAAQVIAGIVVYTGCAYLTGSKILKESLELALRKKSL